MKIIVILIATFMGFRTLYPAISCAESGEYGKAFGYVLEFASVVFLLYNFGGLV